MPQLSVVCDANVPLAREAFGRYGPVRLLPGRSITRADLAGADVLIVRSVTRVDADLLAGTPVRFVGTATAGTDHVRTADLERLGIAFAAAPGSNATSVVEYVLAALLALAARRGEALAGKTLGIVGVGNVGRRLAPRAEALGLNVLCCDPPRAVAEGADGFVSFERLLVDSDIVSVHTPLTDSSESSWPTRGLIGDSAVRRMPPGAWLLNAARGPILDGTAVLAARQSRSLGHGLGIEALVLDCWPGEPAPDVALVDAADLATPHIAGYSAEGKLDGTVQLDAALRAWMASEGMETPHPWSAPAPPARVVAAPDCARYDTEASWLARLQRAAYDVRGDDARFRSAMAATGDEARSAAFSELRRTYPVRHENASAVVRGPVPETLRSAVTDGLGMRIER